LTLHDIIISYKAGPDRLDVERPTQAPFAVIKGAGSLPDQEARISISHEDVYATAVCLAVCPENL
jgi:phosphopantetheinyl transferase (holo-ACP synthase)